MPEYYLDIETYSQEGGRPNPERDKIISIQFQRIDLRTGKPVGDLIILKEWESSEKEIVRDFHDNYFKKTDNVWDFIPVGMCLHFEFEFLKNKFNKYLGTKYTSKELYYDPPQLDIRSLLVLLNGGVFKGASLDRFTAKSLDGSVIAGLYEKKDFKAIEEYIAVETDAYLAFIQNFARNRYDLLRILSLKNKKAD